MPRSIFKTIPELNGHFEDVVVEESGVPQSESGYQYRGSFRNYRVTIPNVSGEPLVLAVRREMPAPLEQGDFFAVHAVNRPDFQPQDMETTSASLNPESLIARAAIFSTFLQE